jgi:hypothetical protein
MGRFSIVAVTALAMLSLSSDLAQAQWVRSGVLTCDVSGGIGLIIGSQRSVNCSFTPDPPGPSENYVGSISKFGLNIGITTAGVMMGGVWYTSTDREYRFRLAGDYVGASGEATVMAGLGANVLLARIAWGAPF